ncbi:MAG: protein kinase [Cyanobacteria bacterium J06643_13]
MQGNILGSRYRVIEYIAEGGFGKTFLAEDTQLPAKNKCVVKQLFPSVDDPNFIQIARRLFKTEAETLNTLGVHNQIPRLMAYFEEDEKFYLVQQYIEGHTLSKELVSGAAWSEVKVIELLKDCLGILNFIHNKSVIHRDVKPDNLIRRQSDNKLVLVDFGTVKAVIAEQTQLVPSTVAVGTRGYMPTEQARGKPRTTSDIYALGVIAIQALTGVHPTQLQEDDSGEIVWKDKAQCSTQLQEVVAKMTRYHFKERYPSAAETLAALDSLSSQSEPEVAAPSMEYTPTVQLSDAELAEMSKRREATAVEASALASDRSVLNTPQNLTNFSAEPLENIAENAIPAQPSNIASPVENEANSMPNAAKSQKNLITLGIALAIGAIASGGMYLLNQRSTQSAQKSVAEQVEQFQAMVEEQDYQTCYDKAIALSSSGDEATEASVMPADKQQEFAAKCGLGTAQAAADDLKYDEALAIAVALPPITSMNTEIREQIDEWSQQLLTQANKIYEQSGDLAKAIETVQQIPQNSSIRPQVIDAKNFWKAETKANEAIITAAEKALSQEKWRYAKQEATKVQESSQSVYWQEQAQEIVARAESALAETTSEPAKAIAPSETKSDPVPQTPKATQPQKPNNPTTANTKSNPVAPQPKPEPNPTVRVDQGSAGELRDLGGNSQPAPGVPSNAPSNNAPLRDL